MTPRLKHSTTAQLLRLLNNFQLLNFLTSQFFNYMKLTLIRTDKHHKQHLSLRSIDKFLERITSDTKGDVVSRLRSYVEWYSDRLGSFDDANVLPLVYPCAEMRLDGQGNPVMKAFNGLVALSVGPLHGRDELNAAKQMASMLPSTVAAFVGSSGQTVKILVAVGPQSGKLPATDDDAEHFYQRACPLVTALYDVLLRHAGIATNAVVSPASLQSVDTPSTGQRLLMSCFRMTLDKHPYYNPKAVAISIGERVDSPQLSLDKTVAPDDADDTGVGSETRRLIALLKERYEFRYNTVMGYTEYRPLERWQFGWQPVDERVQNSLAMEARLAGLNVWDREISRYVKSNMVKHYNPVEEYLWRVEGTWDGRDYLGELARTVPTTNPHWEQWFRTWFLAMVAQWMGRNYRYGNAIAPLLISKQGYNKSTFCKSLIPNELQWGYNDNLILDEKKSVLQAMSQFLLINLDEFNQIRPAVQSGFLKNLIQLSSVKVKRPYGKHVEDFPRLASFIATANVTDILADPTGTRRFIGVELTGPIDVSRRVNHDQLYAQAQALLRAGEPCYLDEEQTRLVMKSNQEFRMESPEELLFLEYFAPATSEQEGEWMTAAAIFQQLKSKVGSSLRIGGIRQFGRFLSNLDSLPHRRSRQGTEYHVLKR